VLVTSWIRKRIGTTWWRRMHLLAVPAFAMSLAHGIFSGTDSARPWMWWVYLVTGSVVVFLVVLRGLTAGYRPVRPAPREVPEDMNPSDRGAPADRRRSAASVV
jgi:DMSO/TMAO reductase YedYZ heme-binding membrane subunit